MYIETEFFIGFMKDSMIVCEGPSIIQNMLVSLL